MKGELWVCAFLLGGCVAGGAPLAQSGTAEPCGRSVAGDVATARARLDAGRTGDALLYVEGLAACPEAMGSARFLQVALDVYEEAGRLNEAFSAGIVAQELLAAEDPARARLAERLGSFPQRYALLTSPRDGRSGPELEFAGPIEDAATQGQVEAVRAGRGVTMPDGTRGYWLLPGSYRLAGQALTLRAGDRALDPRP